MPPSGYLRVGRYFFALLALIVGLYALVFFTGPGSWTDWQEKLTPKLGLDLQGGTTVTLRATTPDGKAPNGAEMEQARQVIEDRVNGSGVAEFEVFREGSRNIVVNVPGDNKEDLKKIGEPAQLRFRQVVESQQSAPKTDSSVKSPASPSTDSKLPTSEEVVAKFPAAAQQAVANATAQGIAVDFEPNPALKSEFSVVDSLTPAEIAALPMDYQLRIPTVTCELLNTRPPGSIEVVDKQVVACERDGSVKYLLDKAEVVGTDVKDADFGRNQEGQWAVSIEFTGDGQKKWTAFTKKSVGKQGAIVLDNIVVSAPNINEVIPGGAEITGAGMGKTETSEIANKLKYGAIEVTFATDTVQEISPTLGIEQLKAGLLAGAIGLLLVVAYSLLYYRALGLVTIASLLISGLLVLASVILLGRAVGFTLTLAGVAGLIVAIGVTVDSFVVFFERLKDEVREGRSVRSAVPRAWVRARRTILSADGVSLLGAVVLYILAVGAVKGFAFALGLATIIDVIVVFLFTHPLVAWASRSKTFASPRISGLGSIGKGNSVPPPRTTSAELATKEAV